MIRICSWCQKIIGEKEPLEDKSLTHGICELCLEKMRQKRIVEKTSKLSENPANPYSKIIDEVITKQVLSTPPDKLTFNDIKWLELNVDAKNKYESKWRVSIPSLKEFIKMPKDNPVKKWYIGLDVTGEFKAFISKEPPSKKDYPQYTKVIGPFDTYRDIIDYIQEEEKENNPTASITKRPSKTKFCVERLVSPTKFDSRSFRTTVARAHRLTFGCPKGQWDNKRGVCKVPVQLQRILHPAGEAKCPVPGKELRNNPGAKWHTDKMQEIMKQESKFPSISGSYKQGYRDGDFSAHRLSVEKSVEFGINPAELATKLNEGIEFTAVELYLEGHGVDDVRILLQQEFGIDRIDAEYYARRAGRIVRGTVASVSPKTERLLRSL